MRHRKRENMRNILVTGGAGFIGSNFVKHMLNTYEYRIINIDVLTYAGNLENLSDIEENPNYTFVRGDIRDRELLDKLFKEYQIDTVVNFAAESHVDRSIENLFNYKYIGYTGFARCGKGILED